MWTEVVFTMASVFAFWVYVDVRKYQLLRIFRERYPNEANRRIKEAFTPWRPPTKTSYWVSRDFATFLEIHDDTELFLMRRSVNRLLAAAVAAPFVAMLVFITLLAFGIIA
tara:strand:- start:508 stop:840 length:333 start_codon:yes stop_codon:yes gene_type:complete